LLGIVLTVELPKGDSLGIFLMRCSYSCLLFDAEFDTITLPIRQIPTSAPILSTKNLVEDRIICGTQA
ncbi:MAG: hypothetical protein K2K97_04290, partial [Muribaculaceae bacterium]|nr:hypothetical protein [Muribaculaceae bacterium]